MFHESAEQTFPVRKGKMSDIPVRKWLCNQRFMQQGKRWQCCLHCVCVCVGGTWGIERQLSSCHRSSDRCSANHWSWRPQFCLHLCSVLQAVEVNAFHSFISQVSFNNAEIIIAIRSNSLFLFVCDFWQKLLRNIELLSFVCWFFCSFGVLFFY